MPIAEEARESMMDLVEVVEVAEAALAVEMASPKFEPTVNQLSDYQINYQFWSPPSLIHLRPE